MNTIKDTKNFGAYLDRTLRMVRLDLGKRIKECGADITPEQWMLLSSLYEKNGQSQTELGNGSFKNAPTVSRIIDLLVKKGLTERQRFNNDRRSYKIFLTPKGEETVEKVMPAIVGTRQKGWRNLSDTDYQHLIRILDTIFDNLQADE